MRRVIVMSGVSGSGKSTHAEKLAKVNDGTIVSADQFFERTDGYLFDPSKLGEVRAFCFRRFIALTAFARRKPVARQFGRPPGNSSVGLPASADDDLAVHDRDVRAVRREAPWADHALAGNVDLDLHKVCPRERRFRVGEADGATSQRAKLGHRRRGVDLRLPRTGHAVIVARGSAQGEAVGPSCRTARRHDEGGTP